METPDTPTPTVTIGGREVSHLVAALIARESDRLGILPGEVGAVAIPAPSPSEVVIAGFRLSIEASAKIAAEADTLGVLPERVIATILRETTESLDRRARTRGTKRPLEGTWAVPSDSPSPGGGQGA